ncbi:MAG: sensor histidine kinase [Robiginitomaculum sp.]
MGNSPAPQVNDAPQQGGSLVWRLVRIAALWVIPALLITAAALIWFYRVSTYKYFDDPLVSTIQALVAHVETDVISGDIVLTSEPIDPRYQLALSGRYWLIGRLGKDGMIKAIESSPSFYGASLRLKPGDIQAINSRKGDVIRAVSVGPDKEPLRLAAQSVIFPGTNDKAVVIIAAADRRPAMATIRKFSFTALGLMSVLALGLVFAMFMQVQFGLRPLFELQGRVADIREGRAKSVVGRYPKEIKPLADELNVLIAHNKEVVEYARTHVSNLAHALKTPLAVLVNESQSYDGKLSDIVERQSEIMSKQVSHHLRRARAAVRGQSIGIQTPVFETLNNLSRTLERIYRDKDLDIDLDIDDGLVFNGERRDLEEMVGNLLDNACKWTQVKIHVWACISEGMIEIIVDDDGPGLASDEYETVLKRGERLDETTPGSGFGLSIVNDLARAYKGKLKLDKSPLGGLRTRLLVPSIKVV